MNKTSKILITGGAGFIGSHLVDYHLTKGDIVRVIDDLSTGSIENLPLAEGNNLDFINDDYTSSSILDSLVTWADRIYHLAAVVGMLKVMENPVKVMRVNMIGTERILQLLTPHQKMVIVSTSEVYSLKSDKEFNFIRWNYALSKLGSEALALSYAKKHNLDISIIRLFNTIGLRQKGFYGMVVPRFVSQAVRDKPITVYGDGLQTRCFCDVEDVVIFFDKLASMSESKGKTFDIGSDRVISILDLAKLIKVRAKSNSDIEFVPYEIAYAKDFEDVRNRQPNLESLCGFISVEYKHSLESMLDKMIEWERK